MLREGRVKARPSRFFCALRWLDFAALCPLRLLLCRIRDHPSYPRSSWGHSRSGSRRAIANLTPRGTRGQHRAMSLSSQFQHLCLGAVPWRSAFRCKIPTMALVASLLPGCIVIHSEPPTITGSGHIVTKVYDQAGFSQVAAGNAFRVTITQGDAYRVAVTVDDNLADLVEVSRSGDKLRIGFKPNTGIRQATLKAEVTLPELIGLELGGATRTHITGFTSDRSLAVDLSGASSLGGDITNANAQIQASGASHLNLHGSARTLKLTAHGASHVNLEGYASDDTTVEAHGASHVTVSSRGKLDVEAHGASSVRYLGTPATVNSHTAGASSVRPR